jgi:hypothetical protein
MPDVSGAGIVLHFEQRPFVRLLRCRAIDAAPIA